VKRQEFIFLLFALCIFGATTSCVEHNYRYEVKVVTIQLDSLYQVIPVIDTFVVPVLYDTLWIDNLSTITEKKQQFINQVLPAILIVRFYEQLKFNKIESIIHKLNNNSELTLKETHFIDSMLQLYEVADFESLPERVKLHPISLVLAQAAIESGWGQSRFAIEGNNLFGIIGNKENSLLTKKGNRTLMRRYDTIEESVKHYFFTIGKHNAYRKFRAKRFEEANVYQMIDELHKYSVKGDDYTEMLKQIIVWNDLKKYDNYKIDSNYIIDKSTLGYFIKNIFKQ
jgi:Bax protein